MRSPTVDARAPSITIGDVAVTALVDLELDFPMGLDQVFPDVPVDAWAPHRQRYPEAFGAEGGWRYRVNCYLVQARDRTVLVDTGCGPATLAFPDFLGVAGSMFERLSALGVGRDAIDIVLITHIHPDHVGGALDPGSATPRAMFERARYAIPRRDVETWSNPGVRDSFPIPFVGQTVDPLIDLGVVDLIDDERQIGRSLTVIPTPGHTPGHHSLLIQSGGESVLLAGDVWLHPAQVTEPTWGSAFDMDAEAATRTRESLGARIADLGMTLGACHFPEPFGQIVRLEGRHHWIALSTT